MRCMLYLLLYLFMVGDEEAGKKKLGNNTAVYSKLAPAANGHSRLYQEGKVR